MEIQNITIRFLDIRKDTPPVTVNCMVNDYQILLNLELTPEDLAKPFYVGGAFGEFIPNLIDRITEAVQERD
jgi:hypothetical protein